MDKTTFPARVKGGGQTLEGTRRNLIIYVPDQVREMLSLEKEDLLEVTVKKAKT